jgi:2-hydroxy-3-keto-5-methylthiopentenyl-1-phosphate phosphatase
MDDVIEKTAVQGGLPAVFIDFDGTISKDDVIDRILEEFADARWQESERRWVSGEIGSRQCLTEQLALVRATPEALTGLIDSIQLDEGLQALLSKCADSRLRVHIVSDGLDLYISRLLQRHFAEHSVSFVPTVWANRLQQTGPDTWGIEFPFFRRQCPHGCATCKPAVMREVHQMAVPSIYIGDGLSDRFAAKSADLVFAKDKLKIFCTENAINHIDYSDLFDVTDIITAEAQRLTATRFPTHNGVVTGQIREGYSG